MTLKILFAQRSTITRTSVLFVSLALCISAGACKDELDPGGQVASVCGEEVPPPPHLPADLYVAKDGSDSNNGTTPETAFATIQYAVDRLQPGQTLEIGPGEYFGPVVADGLGNLEVDTVIRAEIPGTVILRGDIPAPSFAPLAGYNRVHVADFSTTETIHMMNEVDTLKVMPRVPNVAELEWSPGHFYHDVDNDRLYLSTTDTKSATEHFYTLTVTGTHGLYLDAPERVHVQGLTATGFSNKDGLDYGEQTLWATYGIFIRNGKHSVIRDCQAYLNGRGIGLSAEYDPEAGDNLIVDSRAWGNGGVGLSYDTGGIDLLYSRRDQVRNSEAFLNGANGISMRGGVSDHNQGDASYVCNSLSWGNHEHEFWIKMGDNFNYFGNSVAFGTTGNTDHLIRSVSESGSAEGTDSIILAYEEGLDVDAEFADPENYDFRLQGASRFIGTGPAGTDRGAFAYTPNIHYLSPAGNDANDGLSVAQARASFDAALGDLSEGHTLYLTPGTYAEDVTFQLNGSAETPIVIRGRGRDPVVLTGMVRIEGSRYVVFEHIDFAQEVVVEESDEIHFAHDIFMGGGTALSAANTTGLHVRQSTFTGFSVAAIDLPGSIDAHLAGNLFNNTAGPAVLVYTPDDIRYSDYNSYTQLDGSWDVGQGASSTLEDIRASHDELAQEIAPAFTPVTGTVTLDNRVAFYGGATYGNIFGAFRHDIPRDEIRLLEDPSVHSVSSTTANIEWFTSHPTVTTLSWGPTSSVENQTTVESNRFASFSLTGLSPSTTYYLRLDTLEIPEDVDFEAPPVTLTTEVLEFTTAATDMAPQTYYVAETGDDTNPGLTSAQPFRTIQRAADHVNVGDTVLIGGGTYSETVRMRATGTESKPITFQGQPGELVMLDGSSSELDFAFVIGHKASLYFDSFFFSYHGSGASHSGAWEPHMGGQFNIHSSQDIRISRVLSDGRTTGDRLFVAKNVDGLQIRNTFDGNKLEGHYFENCPNLLIENSVFGRPMIAAFILRNSPDESALIRNNIFTDSLAVKSYQDTSGNPNNIFLVIIDGSQDSVVMEDNLFFLRYFSPDDRALVMDEGHAELDGVLLFDTVFADPEFQGISDLLDAGGELSLYDDSLPPFPPDSLWSLEQQFTFRTWFATNPDVVSAGIGLDQSQFDAGTGLPN